MFTFNSPGPNSQQDPLTDGQIRWLEAQSDSFKRARRAVKKADEHSQRVKERLLEGERT